MKPLVSICMPHLNSLPFTEERLKTIAAQTLTDWELIIVDSHSDDGSLAILDRFAAADRRVRIVQAPRDGIYTGLNRALKLASGAYIYIATSDDTMAPHCLERMAAALKQNPACGLCHCNLEIIDENSRPVGGDEAWLQYPAQRYFGDWIQKPHIRLAPQDGLLHFGFYSVTTSLTQLLVRREVFERVGYFRTDCGPAADAEWGARAGLQENIVHVPEPLATWRRHRQQATHAAAQLQARASGAFRRFTRNALDALAKKNPRLSAALAKSRLNDFHVVDEFKALRALNPTPAGAALAAVRFATRHPLFSLRWTFSKASGHGPIVGDFGAAFRDECSRLGLPEMLRPLDPNMTPASTPPTLSVGLPVYNGERYLNHTLDTLLSQDYRDFELIISDNGSTDATETICRARAAADPRVKYHRADTNRGSTWNFRRVLELAQGKYFKWATYDDACYPGMFRRCIEALEESDPSVAMVYPRFEVIDESGALSQKDLGPRWDRVKTDATKPHQRVGHILWTVLYGHPAYGVIKMSYLRQTRPWGMIAADWVKLLELGLLGKIVEVPEVLFQLRLHPMNAMVATQNWRNLLAWHDPNWRRRKLVLPKSCAFVVEYLKAIHASPIPIADKVPCYAVACLTPPWRWFCQWALRVTGPVRIKLRDVTGWGWLSRHRGSV
jgi:glycosyltransferase involved in cell wall biosynthesis